MRTDGQTDRHDEANCRFSQFCERAYKWLRKLNITVQNVALWWQSLLALQTATAAIQPLQQYSHCINTATAAIQLLQQYSYCRNTATAAIQLPQEYSYRSNTATLSGTCPCASCSCLRHYVVY